MNIWIMKMSYYDEMTYDDELNNSPMDYVALVEESH